MLRIEIPETEFYDNEKEEFVNFKSQKLQLEHSLVSLSKWESKWKSPFLVKEEKTVEQTLDYIRCMTITQNVPPSVYLRLTDDNVKEINAYIEDSMTATTFPEDEENNSREIITAEVIYYWMIALNIPKECEKWHLNRLLTLITVANIKNNPPKKKSKAEIMRRNNELNAKRKRELNTKG